MITPERLKEIVVELVTRPGHEKVRTLVYELLVNGLGASSWALEFEKPLPEVRGRADALLGRTIFEFKRDLRRETGDAEEELTRYLSHREAETRERFVGIATDGQAFVPYELRDGRLVRLTPFHPVVDDPRGILAWLDAAASLLADLTPDLETVRKEFGRASLTHQIAHNRLADLWAEVKEYPEVTLKRQLWADLLERVYGSSVDSDDLFFQHTFLTIVAKAMATRVLGVELPAAGDLLAGQPFQDAGIEGAVESDFFDWVLVASGGADVVARIARQVARFRLADVQTDVLKGLYESLIDPEQRRYLGEYYTPDWLAARMCDRLIADPLNQRVLDPACGSGTFLFHSVRRFLAAADAAGLGNHEALARCCGQVLGVDVHPVAVLIARVTYLLAFGARLRDHPRMSIPVYLGDSLQWNTRGFLAEREVLIQVPDGPELHFPASVASDPAFFDSVLQTMIDLSEGDAPPEAVRAWLRRTRPVDQQDEDSLVDTYDALRTLRREQRNHIWGYVARNLSRPVWLSQQEQRADVVLGNPPWLSYRFMSRAMQERFREESQRRGIWVGAVAQQQDLSAYFFARCVELYLKPNGMIAFVMPYSAMTRRQFARFRTGIFGERRGNLQQLFSVVRFVDAWAFSDEVSPLFPVPSCVLFAEHEPNADAASASRLPDVVSYASGQLGRRDATLDEASGCLDWRQGPWPAARGANRESRGSPYSDRFRAGAVIFPSLLFRVQRVEAGRIGGNPSVPLVESRRTNLEKRPWKELPSLRGNVEQAFLRPLYLGESIAPFRLLRSGLAVIPWDPAAGLMDAQAAQRRGYLSLGHWLAGADGLWQAHGRNRRTLIEQLDYFGQLSAQLPPAPLRVVYAASGTLPAAAILRDATAVIEHKLYWAAAGEDEACYLTTTLNSETARSRVAHMQSRGQWGARDFDKLMFELPIPRFDGANARHQALVAAAKEAETVAAQVPLTEAMHFVGARRRIRAALRADGVAQRIEALVAELLELAAR